MNEHTAALEKTDSVELDRPMSLIEKKVPVIIADTCKKLFFPFAAELQTVWEMISNFRPTFTGNSSAFFLADEETSFFDLIM